MNYRLIKNIALCCLLTVSISCKNDSPKKAIEKQPVVQQKKQQVTQKKIETPEKKATDTITSKNAIDFLIAYGKLHKENKVRFTTRLGDIIIKLYDDTPLHRASFIFLTKVGYFNTTCFHRIVPNFIVQGGNSENSKTLIIRNRYQNYTIPAEFRKHHTHKYGALAAARDWEDNPTKKSTPFEFYFIQDKRGAHHLDGEHTVFGEIISGFDVLDKIAGLKTGRDEWPLEDVFIKAEVIE
jgi:peptidylprolyl isomerase